MSITVLTAMLLILQRLDIRGVTRLVQANGTLSAVRWGWLCAPLANDEITKLLEGKTGCPTTRLARKRQPLREAARPHLVTSAALPMTVVCAAQ